MSGVVILQKIKLPMTTPSENSKCKTCSHTS